MSNKIEILLEIENCLRGYDCMLIETGGRYDGKENVDRCVILASAYLKSGNNKEDIIFLVDTIMSEFKEDTSWKYQKKMIDFLANFKNALSTL